MFSDGINTATLNDFYAYQSGGDKRFGLYKDNN
jgi:hypothetical protein